MLKKLWYALASIRNYDRIPKLPRGMLSARYTTLTPKEREVMARIGARDPAGVKVAMKRYGVSSEDELLALLEHYRPRRRFWHRVMLAVGRVVGGEVKPTHVEELRRAARRDKRSFSQIEVEARLKHNLKAMEDEDLKVGI